MPVPSSFISAFFSTRRRSCHYYSLPKSLKMAQAINEKVKGRKKKIYERPETASIIHHPVRHIAHIEPEQNWLESDRENRPPKLIPCDPPAGHIYIYMCCSVAFLFFSDLEEKVYKRAVTELKYKSIPYCLVVRRPKTRVCPRPSPFPSQQSTKKYRIFFYYTLYILNCKVLGCCRAAVAFLFIRHLNVFSLT